MERLLSYIKNNTSSRLVNTAIDVASKNPSLREDMLLYVFKYLLEENKEMESKIKELINKKSITPNR